MGESYHEVLEVGELAVLPFGGGRLAPQHQIRDAAQLSESVCVRAWRCSQANQKKTAAISHSG
jgi:hypothetical protein